VFQIAWCSGAPPCQKNAQCGKFFATQVASGALVQTTFTDKHMRTSRMLTNGDACSVKCALNLASCGVMLVRSKRCSWQAEVTMSSALTGAT
jgi:hypothetical protein